MAKKPVKPASQGGGQGKRQYLSQTDVPSLSLDQALRVARAFDEYGGRPARPLDIARALKVQPTSGPFKTLCGAAIAYGLTEGGYNAPQVSLTALGKRIIKPTIEGDDAVARREAVLQPRVVREFLQRYDGSKLPREDIGLNVLETMGVPKQAAARALNAIVEGAQSAGFLKDINGVSYVDLQNTDPPQTVGPEAPEPKLDAPDPQVASKATNGKVPTRREEGAAVSGDLPASDLRLKRVFVTHGKNRGLVPQLKELLEFGQFIPVVSVERESVSKPVPDKVMDDMRACGAAIIHVDADRELMTPEGGREVVLNGNVLIEIGAAMALFGRRFILLVQDGIRLPSNLQGLYEVRYKGEQLDGEATLRLLKAFNEFKNYALVNP